MAIHKYDNKVAEKISKHLLKISSIKIQPNDPFTWASGWKSPIYCDNRLSLSFPKVRSYIKHQLKKIIKEKYKGVQAIAGVATAGIPQGALVADELGLPFIYVRSKTKGHGLQNQIEGLVQKGLKVVLVEDLVSTGGSSLQASEAIREADMEVLGMVSIFTYGLPVSDENFKRHNTELWYLSDYATTIKVGVKKGIIKEEEVDLLSTWRSNPAQWGQEEEKY
ncbi:MAG: orotate phosphoribosyltransferase [Cyclobacteriaceae bacterium]